VGGWGGKEGEENLAVIVVITIFFVGCVVAANPFFDLSIVVGVQLGLFKTQTAELSGWCFIVGFFFVVVLLFVFVTGLFVVVLLFIFVIGSFVVMLLFVFVIGPFVVVLLFVFVIIYIACLGLRIKLCLQLFSLLIPGKNEIIRIFDVLIDNTK